MIRVMTDNAANLPPELREQYGIRELCKIFCMSDTLAYANLTRHVRFVRHSDRSDGDCCHDDVYQVKK